MTDFNLKVYGQLGGAFQWSFGLFVTGNPPSEGALEAAHHAAINAWWTTAVNGFDNFATPEVTLTGTSTATLTASLKQVSKTSTSFAALAGTNAVESLPWDSVVILTTRSAFATKSAHGRIKMPTIGVNNILTGRYKPATLTSLKTVWNQYFTSVTGAGVNPFIYNKHTKKDGTPANTKTLLNAFDLSDIPARDANRLSKFVPNRVTGGIIP